MDEQRTEYRLSQRTMVVLEIPQAVDGMPEVQRLACRVLDFSASGLQVHLDRPLLLGQVLRVQFHPLRQPPIAVMAEVRWQRHLDSGVRAGLSIYLAADTDTQRWKEFVADQLA